MNFEFNLGAMSSAAGAAVLHFLWQGAVIGVLAAAALRGCRREAAQARYCVALAALGACGLVFLVTLVLQLAAPVSAGMGRAPVIGAEAASLSSWGLLLRAETVSVLWCCGVAALTVRLCLQLAAVRRLSHGGAGEVAPPAHWVDAFERMKARLGVHKAVRLVQHASIDTPMVVGWFAPVVLVPAAAFVSLTPDQLCAVLAHELAHIRRGDHLVNAVQAVIEVALFFHPVVWWLSSTVRVEREHCCDDVAVGAAASPLVFAEALARLETLRHVFPQAAVAANGGSLMERIERVLKVEKTPAARSLRWNGAVAIGAAAVIAVAALAQVSVQPGAAPAAAPAADGNHLLRLVVPTVYVPAVDDDQDVSPDKDGLYLIELGYFSDSEDLQQVNVDMPVKFQVQLTPAQHARMMKKEAEGATKKLETTARVVQLVRTDEEAERLRQIVADLDAAVEDGAITREEADMHLAELKAQAEQHRRKEVRVQLRLDRDPQGQDDRAVDVERQELDKVTADLDAAVNAGTLTRAEADERMEVLKKAAAERQVRAKQAAEREELAKREAAEHAQQK